MVALSPYPDQRANGTITGACLLPSHWSACWATAGTPGLSPRIYRSGCGTGLSRWPPACRWRFCWPPTAWRFSGDSTRHCPLMKPRGASGRPGHRRRARRQVGRRRRHHPRAGIGRQPPRHGRPGPALPLRPAPEDVAAPNRRPARMCICTTTQSARSATPPGRCSGRRAVAICNDRLATRWATPRRPAPCAAVAWRSFIVRARRTNRPLVVVVGAGGG